MLRRTGGLLLVACLAACSTTPGVTATEARRGADLGATTVPAETSPPTTNKPPPVLTLPTFQPPNSSVLPASDANGIGDTLFPSLGNPGIDVDNYDVILDYESPSHEITATVHLDVTMTEDRPSFTLDSDGPTVSSVLVDGVAAKFDAERPELLITPATPLVKGQRIGVDVAYTVAPNPVPSAAGQEVGWFITPGGSFVLNEPEGAHTWLPSDDHPSDPATYHFEITVPLGVTAVANGAMTAHNSTDTSETWVWQEDRPMATYLIQVLTGDYELVDGVGPNGLPLLSAVLRKDRTTMQPYLDAIGGEIDYFDGFFGPYPLDRYGIAISDSFGGLAMETTERSLFSRDDFLSGRLDYDQQRFLSHELAHQWFGDAVTPAKWSDIWLNESFATYGEWMWLDHVGLDTMDGLAAAGLAAREPIPTADPSAAGMFGFNSYDGGAVVLHALRKTIGDDLFFTLLRRWVTDNEGTSRTTADFVALAGEVAGRDLTDFFNTWLFAAVVPSTYPA